MILVIHHMIDPWRLAPWVYIALDRSIFSLDMQSIFSLNQIHFAQLQHYRHCIHPALTETVCSQRQSTRDSNHSHPKSESESPIPLHTRTIK